MAFAAVVVRLTQLQVVSPDDYAARSEAQRVRTVTLPAERGTIFDRNGNELAMSVRRHTVWADPRLVEDPQATAAALAPVLGLDAGELAASLDGDGRFVYLARKVDQPVAEAVAALELDGISLLEESRRYNPGGDLATSILGQVDLDNRGTAGLEDLYEDQLVGRPGELLLERGIDGRTIAAGRNQLTPAERGDDLVLTIDRSLQHEVERALGAAVTEHDADGGTAVVGDPSTGEILAMANMVRGGEGEPARPSAHNKAVIDTFEPGSVMKVVTAAAALEEDLRTPEQPWEVPYSIRLPGKPSPFVDDHPAPGPSSLRDVMTRSSNVGTIQLAQQLGEDRVHEYLRRFGFGEATGLGGEAEPRGRVPHPDEWTGPSIGTIPIGQGVSVTAVQMLGAMNAIANGGELVEPTVVRATIDAEGDEHRHEAGARRRVVSEETAAAMRDILTDVVASEEGTGQRAAVAGYDAAGKTGTARKPATDHRGYEPGAYVATFAGFVPSQDPKLSIIVVLDEPKPYYAGLVSAPVFSQIAQFALREFRVPPPAGTEAGASDPVHADAPVPRD